MIGTQGYGGASSLGLDSGGDGNVEVTHDPVLAVAAAQFAKGLARLQRAADDKDVKREPEAQGEPDDDGKG